MQSIILERSGSQLHYWLSGVEGQPLVVFTHGATMDHHLFDHQVATIGQHYRVLTWDARGHGLSKPIGDHFTNAAAAEDLVALIHVAGYQQAALVGQSMGSYISQEAIFGNPDLAWAFVSIGGTCITLSHSALDMFLLNIAVPLTKLYPYEWLKQTVKRSISVTPEGQDYALKAMNHIGKREYDSIMTAVSHCIHPAVGYRIDCPLLLVNGDHDNTGSVEKYTRLWAQRDGAALPTTVPDAGHNANYDNPAFFNSLLLDFLAQHAPRQ